MVGCSPSGRMETMAMGRMLGMVVITQSMAITGIIKLMMTIVDMLDIDFAFILN